MDISCLLCHLPCSPSISILFFLLSSASCHSYKPWVVSNTLYHSWCLTVDILFCAPSAIWSSLGLQLPSCFWFLHLIAAAIIWHCLNLHIEKGREKERVEKERVCLLTCPEHPVSPFLLLSLSGSRPSKYQKKHPKKMNIFNVVSSSIHLKRLNSKSFSLYLTTEIEVPSYIYVIVIIHVFCATLNFFYFLVFFSR